MKTSLTTSSKYINLVAYFLAVVLLDGSMLNAQSFRLFAVSDLLPVFEDGYKLPPMYDTIKVFGIRGETISGQFALSTKKGLTGVTVEIGPLKNQVSGSSFPANAVSWNYVGSVPLTTNAPNQPPSAVVRPAPAMFPDYLMSEKQINVKEKSYQAIWVTINIPDAVEAGKYSGKVTIKSAQGDMSLPVQLTVYPLTLPSARHLKIAIRFYVNNFDKYHGIKDSMYSDTWYKMLKVYADNMVAHRQNVVFAPINIVEIIRSKSGKIEFDFTRFDKRVEVFMNTGKMDFIETGYGLTRWGNGGWFSSEIELSNFSAKNLATGKSESLAGKDVIPYLLPAFESHLRQKGWLDKALFGVRNEPSLHNAIPYCEMSSYFHQLAPDLKQFESIETTMFGGLDVPGPKLDHLAAWYESFRDAQERGTEVCYYITGIQQGSRYPSKTIDVPVMDSRIMPWLNYKYNLSGIKHFGWNQWSNDPYHQLSPQNGCSWHVYPVERGLLNSLRWEQMRNGVEDFEYFWSLENKIKILKDSLGSRFAWIDPKQRGREIASRVVTSFWERTGDPQVLYQAKQQVINDLLNFNVSPRIYVQTNPDESSTLTNRSSVEVYGWTEPGTKIVINGTEIPVNEQGLFLEKFFLYGPPSKSNFIKVQATNPHGSKEIVRDFIVK